MDPFSPTAAYQYCHPSRHDHKHADTVTHTDLAPHQHAYADQNSHQHADSDADLRAVSHP